VALRAKRKPFIHCSFSSPELEESHDAYFFLMLLSERLQLLLCAVEVNQRTFKPRLQFAIFNL
jgi:hypothetical protein